MDRHLFPSVIVTDRELALMNAIERIFPDATHLLCRWHINKNVLAKCKKLLGTKDQWDVFNSAWNMLMQSHDAPTMKERIERLCHDFAHSPGAVEYCLKQWVMPYHKKFVAYCTNEVKHYGNTTTNMLVTYCTTCSIKSSHARSA